MLCSKRALAHCRCAAAAPSTTSGLRSAPSKAQPSHCTSSHTALMLRPLIICRVHQRLPALVGHCGRKQGAAGQRTINVVLLAALTCQTQSCHIKAAVNQKPWPQQPQRGCTCQPPVETTAKPATSCNIGTASTSQLRNLTLFNGPAATPVLLQHMVSWART